MIISYPTNFFVITFEKQFAWLAWPAGWYLSMVFKHAVGSFIMAITSPSYWGVRCGSRGSNMSSKTMFSFSGETERDKNMIFGMSSFDYFNANTPKL